MWSWFRRVARNRHAKYRPEPLGNKLPLSRLCWCDGRSVAACRRPVAQCLTALYAATSGARARPQILALRLQGGHAASEQHQVVGSGRLRSFRLLGWPRAALPPAVLQRCSSLLSRVHLSRFSHSPLRPGLQHRQPRYTTLVLGAPSKQSGLVMRCHRCCIDGISSTIHLHLGHRRGTTKPSGRAGEDRELGQLARG